MSRKTTNITRWMGTTDRRLLCSPFGFAGSLRRSLACRAEPRQNLAGNLIEPDDILVIAEPADLALDK